jgi:hypothetical protein
MGDLVGIRTRAIEIGKQACLLDGAKKYEEAFPKYLDCIEKFNHCIKCIEFS